VLLEWGTRPSNALSIQAPIGRGESLGRPHRASPHATMTEALGTIWIAGAGFPRWRKWLFYGCMAGIWFNLSWDAAFFYLFGSLDLLHVFLALLIPAAGIVPALLIFTAKEVRAVGLNERGIVVRRRFRKDVELQWGEFEPQFFGRSPRSFFIRCADPSGLIGDFSVTAEQGRAIVTHTAAPRWPMSPAARAKWVGEST
jgi:hypothetical protein